MARRMIVLTRDRTGTSLGGNAARATELARVLAEHGDVALAAPGEPPDAEAPFAHLPWDADRPRELRSLLRGADVVVSAPQSPVIAAELRRCDARLILDLYDPFPLAALESHREQPGRRRLGALLARDALLEGLRMAHHAICASERQRDFYLGAMLAAGLLRPDTYDADPSFRERIDVVPIGVPNAAPIPGRPLRDGLGLGDDADIVLWYGGLWGWVDPVTPVLAMPELIARRPHAHLVFLGRTPAANAGGGKATRALGVARELGLADDRVRFLETVAPYAERGAWLLDADCAVSAHREHLETRFAFRTRILDFIWAQLPVVCSRGDATSEVVERRALGRTVAPEDPSAMAAALADVLSRGRDAYAPAFASAAEAFSWSRVAAPLTRFATASARPPRLGESALAPALPGPPARAAATRALRAGRRALNR